MTTVSTETTPATEAENRLNVLALSLVRRVAEHNIMTSDDNCDLQYAYDAATHAEELATLLTVNPHIDATFPMLTIAEQELGNLIDDMHEYMDYQEAEPELPLRIIAAYETVAERLSIDTSGLDEVKADFEARD
jgi:hypothetical protein